MNSARLIHLASTPSTMTEAGALAAAGEPHGSVVVADLQTAGMGRHGRQWDSEDGGLYFSMIFRLAIPAGDLPVLTMALGLAVQSAVNDFAHVSADLRWPNDVLLNEKKLAGILVQASNEAVIAGVGLNVNQSSFPLGLQSIATSLLLETGHGHSKTELLNRLRTMMLSYSQTLAERGRREIFRIFSDHSSYVAGKQVQVDLGDRIIRGTTLGLDENGFLLVATSGGTETILAGGVRSV